MYDLIITNSSHKKKLLQQDSKKLVKYKILTYQEFIDKIFFTTNQEAVYYLVDKYNFCYDVAKKYLNNIIYDLKELNKYYQELDQNNLIIKDLEFLNNYQNILFKNVLVDELVLNKLQNKNITIQTYEIGSNKPNVYKCDTMETEIHKLCEEIINLNIELSKIKVVLSSDYYFSLKRISKMYNLNFNFPIGNTIATNSNVIKFINNLKETKNIKISLKNLENTEIYNDVISVINKYSFQVSITDALVHCLESEIINKKLKPKLYTNAIEIIDINAITNDDNYYFILGLNETILPKLYKDDNFLSDVKNIELGLSTSVDKNKFSKIQVSSIITNTKNIYISYKEKNSFTTYHGSSLIKDLDLLVIPAKITYNYSNTANNLFLGSMLDKFYKFNIKNPQLETLYSNYQPNYNTYDNKYTNIAAKVPDYRLSYSSIDTFYKCRFRYYVARVLKIDHYESNFSANIGNIFHDVLSKMYEDDFDLDTSYKSFSQKYEFTNMEKFFLNKLKFNLQEIIEVIKFQDEQSSLNQVLTEQEIEIIKDNVPFIGFVDKIKYKQTEEETIISIIDYKTGYLATNIDNINYGLNLQLPTYIYLSNQFNLKNVTIGGFYLQKLLTQKTIKGDYLDKYKLDGYTNSNQTIAYLVDNNYEKSEYIKSLKTLKTNEFAKSAKVLNEKNINTIIDIVDQKISEAINNIKQSNFDINPVRIGDKLEGCSYCKFSDICYKKEEDIVIKENTPIKDILGGKINA